MPQFIQAGAMPVSARELFSYHDRPGAFERLKPPWERIEIVDRQGGIRDGDSLTMRIRKGPFRVTWRAVHRDFEEGRAFCDEQAQGPFARWRHCHRFLPQGAARSELRDEVDYALPMGFLGAALGGRSAARTLRRMFAFRHRRTRDDLSRHARYAGQGRKTAVIVGPPSLFIHELACFLSVGGHDVHRLSWRDSLGGSPRFLFEHYFSGEASFPLERADALIHVPFSPADVPGGDERPNEHLAFLVRALDVCGHKPDLLLHLRGQRTDLREYADDPSLDFKRRGKRQAYEEAREDALNALAQRFERELTLHFGAMIRPPMGYLVNMLLRLETYLFLKDGARSPTFDWISMDDAVGAVHCALFETAMTGDVAAVAPRPAERAELQRLLIKSGFASYTLHRIFKVMPWAQPGLPPELHARFAEMSKLAGFGFPFLTPELPQALRHELGEAGDP